MFGVVAVGPLFGLYSLGRWSSADPELVRHLRAPECMERVLIGVQTAHCWEPQEECIPNMGQGT